MSLTLLRLAVCSVWTCWWYCGHADSPGWGLFRTFVRRPSWQLTSGCLQPESSKTPACGSRPEMASEVELEDLTSANDASEAQEFEIGREDTENNGRKFALHRVSSMPTPCRARRLTSKQLQAMDGSHQAGALRRKLSEGSLEHSWLQIATAKEGTSRAMTPSTRTPSPAPSLRSYANPLSQSLPSRARRPSRRIERSSSEVLLIKQPGEELPPGLEEAFWKLCASNRGEVGIDCRHFDKLCKDAGWLDPRFTTADADLIFTSVTGRSLRRLDVQHFESALRLLAHRKCLPADVVFDKVKKLASSESTNALERSSAAAGPRIVGNAPPPTPPLRRTPSLALLETPPRHRHFASPTLNASASGQQRPPSQGQQRPGSSPPRPQTAPRGAAMEAWGSSSQNSQGSARLKPLEGSYGRTGGGGGGPRGSEGAERELLLDTFASFCWGRTDMDGRGFARLCRDCRLLDSRFTALDADLLFTKVLPKGQRRLDLDSFDAALSIIAERRKVSESAIRRSIAFCHGPLVRATQTGIVRLHDDRGGYTGTHVLGGPEPGALGAGTVASIW